MHLLLFLLVVIVGSASAAPATGTSANSQGTGQLNDVLLGCEDNPADIYFLLDCSSSVWIVDFEKQLEFVISLVQHLNIHPDATRVGLGVFSDRFLSVIDIGRYRTRESLIAAIRAAPYLSGNTYTGRGLHGLRIQGFRSGVVRPNVTKIGVVVTDGDSRHRSNTVAEAALAKEQNIWLFAIGVGSKVDREELYAIASQPKADFVFRAASFDILSTMTEALAVSTCKLEKPQADNAACGKDRKADVMFVYNAGALSSRDISKVREFTRKVVGEFSMTSGNVRAGVISEGCQGGDIELSEHVRRDDFVNALMSQPKPELAPLLKKLRLQGYDPARGGRPDAAKMAVVFVDDVMTSRDDLLYEALLLEYDDVLIHVVAVGSTYSLEEVKQLARSPNHITEFSGYEDLVDDAKVKEFRDKFCVGL